MENSSFPIGKLHVSIEIRISFLFYTKKLFFLAFLKYSLFSLFLNGGRFWPRPEVIPRLDPEFLVQSGPWDSKGYDCTGFIDYFHLHEHLFRPDKGVHGLLWHTVLKWNRNGPEMGQKSTRNEPNCITKKTLKITWNLASKTWKNLEMTWNFANLYYLLNQFLYTRSK